MNERQIQWAARHDWFVSSGDGYVVAREIVRLADGTIDEVTERFDDYRTLREWAGY